MKRSGAAAWRYFPKLISMNLNNCCFVLLCYCGPRIKHVSNTHALVYAGITPAARTHHTSIYTMRSLLKRKQQRGRWCSTAHHWGCELSDGLVAGGRSSFRQKRFILLISMMVAVAVSVCSVRYFNAEPAHMLDVSSSQQRRPTPLYCRAWNGESDATNWLSRESTLRKPFVSDDDALPTVADMNQTSLAISECPHPTILVTIANNQTWYRLLEDEVFRLATYSTHQFFQARRVRLLAPTTGDYGKPPDASFLGECAKIAMESPCSVGFQLIVKRHDFDCVVLFPMVNKDMEYLTPVDPHAPFHLFLHYYESRPSMWSDDLRLVFVSPTPEDTIFLQEDTEEAPLTFTSGALQNVTVALDIHRRVGELTLLSDPEMRFFDVRLTMRCGKTVTVTSLPVSATGRVTKLEVVLEHPLMHLKDCKGGGVTISATTNGIFRDSPFHLNATMHLFVVMLANRVEAFLGRKSSGEAHLPTMSKDCASYLAPNEYCLTNVHVALMHRTKNSHITAASLPASILASPMVTLTPFRSHRCLRIVDGHVAFLHRIFGNTTFDHLVISIDATCLPSVSGIGSDGVAPPREWRLVVSSPFSSPEIFSQLAVGGSGQVVDIVLNVPSLLSAAWNVSLGVRSTSQTSSRTPEAGGFLLISLPIYKNMKSLELQLRNIAVFVPASVVVLHVSPMWRLTHNEWQILRGFNGTAHPRLFISSKQYPLSFTLLFAVQMWTARWFLQSHSHLPIARVMFMSSNEFFLRHGVEEYVLRYDLSFPGAEPCVGIGCFHSYPQGLPLDSSAWLDPSRDTRFQNTMWNDRIGPGGLQGSLFWYPRGMKALRKRFPTGIGEPKLLRRQLFTEGSFFVTEVVLEIAEMLDSLVGDLAMNPSSSEQCFPSWYAWSETAVWRLIQPYCSTYNNNTTSYSHLSSLRCGSPFSTVAWNRPRWTVTPRDVSWMRCSPYGRPPFSMKRIEVNSRVHDSVVKILRSIMKDAETTMKQPRDNASSVYNCQRFVPVLLGM